MSLNYFGEGNFVKKKLMNKRTELRNIKKINNNICLCLLFLIHLKIEQHFFPEQE